MGRLKNNPSIGWVHPKSKHACAWGNRNLWHLEHMQSFPLATCNFSYQNCWLPFLANRLMAGAEF